MSAKEWVFGSALRCDVWIPEDTVSGSHCRLRKTSQGFLLEDLGSTNGTFVAGKRITQPTPVVATTKVILGGLTPLPWPTAEGASRVVRFGRGADNEFTINAANVSTHHGEIIVGPTGTWVVVDMNSTNGIGLKHKDSFQVIYHAALIGPADTLLLGKLELPVQHIKPLFQAPAVPASLASQPTMVAEEGTLTDKDRLPSTPAAPSRIGFSDGADRPTTVASGQSSAVRWAIACGIGGGLLFILLLMFAAGWLWWS